MRTEIIRIKETIASITAEEAFIPIADQEIRCQREALEAYVHDHPDFLHALNPIPIDKDAPEIIRRMAEAAALVGVGPMAAVAGAISEFALRAMIRAGSKHAIVANGGDIAMLLDNPAIVGIFTGPARIRNLGLKFMPDPRIIGICTSSGTVGHSLSFGYADAAIVISRDVCLADAAATALGNAAKIKEPSSLEQAIDTAWVPGIEGMLLIMDDLMAMKGQIPEIVRARVSPEKMALTGATEVSQ
jgi:hypothetical protein